MKITRYLVTLQGFLFIRRIEVISTNEADAIARAIEAEGCPRSCFRSCEVLKVLH